MNRRTGLGRGLAALIPPQVDEEDPREASSESGDERQQLPNRSEYESTAPTADPSRTGSQPVSSIRDATHSKPTQKGAAHFLEISIDEIQANARQPRQVFDPGELEGLATSLLDVGILQPLVVRPSPEGGYELVAGERRLRAAKLAGITAVPAVVRHTQDADLLKEALVENIQRVQLNPLEEAAAYQQLLDEFGVTQDELAARLGRSRSAITNTIRLLRLPSPVQKRVAAGVLSAGHARALLALDDVEVQRRVAERIVAEGLSVRDVEELVRLRLTDQTPSATPQRRRGGTEIPGLVELQQDLSDALETRVKVTMGARRGRIAIEFGSVDDLERIVDVIANGLGVDSAIADRDARDADTQ